MIQRQLTVCSIQAMADSGQQRAVSGTDGVCRPDITGGKIQHAGTYQQKARIWFEKGKQDTGKGKQVFPLSAALKKGSGRRSSGIQIFSNADHADHRKEHQKSLPPETKTVSGEQ